MPAYPSGTSVPRKTPVRPINENTIELAEDGTPMPQDLGATTAYQITVRHEYITSADMATLRAFRDANLSSLITIDANDGHTYNCFFKGRDYDVEEVSAAYVHAIITLVGTRQ